jgi:hypothetical protein
MPEPESGLVSFSVPDELDVRVPIEVRDSSLALVQSAYAGQEIEVPAGSYVVSTLLPTGEQHTEVVEVKAGSQETVPLTAPAPSPEPVGAAEGDLEALGAEPTGAPWFLRFVPAEPGADPEVREVVHGPDRLEAALNIHSAGLRVTFAQIAAEGQVPVSIALPIGQGTLSSTCELRVVVTPDRLDAAVSLGRVGELHGVAEYLARGHLEAATEVLEDAEGLLHGKMSDPIGAALGGYALLRLGMLDRLHDWPRNLSDLFDWLPDGAVIAAEQAWRTEDHETALAQLELAVRRGLPVFADGFSILLARLNEYSRCETRPKGVTDERVRFAARHAERLGALAPFVDFGSLVLSVRGADPTDPAGTHRPLEDPSRADGWLRFDPVGRALVDP